MGHESRFSPAFSPEGPRDENDLNGAFVCSLVETSMDLEQY